MTKKFTPQFPSADLNLDEVATSDLVLYLSSIIDHEVLEYRFALGQTESIFSDEDINCDGGAYRNLSLSVEDEEDVVLDPACYGQCSEECLTD